MAVNLEMKPKKNDTPERFIKRFIKKVKKLRIIESYKDKMTYKKPSEKKQERRKRWKREKAKRKLEEN
tara:strand:- start:88 stop:291 length:204 start_codon:yes stop_codon:yes gene_type:complete